MTATTVYHAPTPVPLCTTRDPRWWDRNNPNNHKAIELCRRCPFLAACEPSEDERADGVRAGRLYKTEDPVGAGVLDPHRDAIAELLQQPGISAKGIANRFNVSVSTVYSFLDDHFDGARPRPTTSQYRGVSWYARNGRWLATIMIDKRKKGLGYFATEIEAARAYDRAARELGRRLNFPDETA